MARVWAQEWKTPNGDSVYTVHVHQSDIVQFGVIYNRSQYEHNLLTQYHRAWQTEVDGKTVQQIHDHGYGLRINRRPR